MTPATRSSASGRTARAGSPGSPRTCSVPRRAPDSAPAAAGSSRAGAEAVGNAMPRSDRDRQDDEERRAEERRERLERVPGAGLPAATMTTTARAIARTRDHDLGHGQQRTGREARPEEVEQHRPDGDADQEDREDHREHVGRVAGPRGEQPGPGHLVAERCQARDEREPEGEAAGGRAPRVAARRASRAGDASWSGAASRRVARRGRRAGARARAAARQRERHESGDQRASRPDPQRPGQAEQLDQDEPRGQRPDDRADRVRRVEAAERPAERRSPARGGGSGSGTWRPSGSWPARGPGRRSTSRTSASSPGEASRVG